jgi:hypothetical protein
MGENTHGPPGPNRGRRPGEGAASWKSQSVSSAGYSRQLIGQQVPFINPLDTELARPRAENALLVRVRRQMRRILDELGGRALLDLAIECAGRRTDLATLDALAGEWLKRGRRDWLRATGGGQFITEFAIDIAPGSRRR